VQFEGEAVLFRLQGHCNEGKNIEQGHFDGAGTVVSPFFDGFCQLVVTGAEVEPTDEDEGAGHHNRQIR